MASVALWMLLGPTSAALAGPPTLTITSPPNNSISNNQTPSFSGATTDTLDKVTLSIYTGTAPTGPVVQSISQFPTMGDTWSAGPVETLTSGTYTAQATQAAEQSEPVTFTVETAPPKVALTSPASLSNNTEPSFTGTASDATTVTVQIYAGPTATGTVVSSATAPGTGGAWTSGKASPALASGQYTATATQTSSLGNPPGTSSAVTFTVDTAAPAVTLNKPASPSSNTTPSFTGSASDKTSVAVEIHQGATSSGPVVASASAKGTGGGWTSSEASPALASGQYTAVAIQKSSIENPDGVSEAQIFTVDTAPPIVTLNQVPTPSNDTTPSFTGTAGDTNQVTVTIYKGTTAVSTATAPGTGGNWGSSEASPPLANGSYTAVATQPSSLGNAPGVSSTISFKVDTNAPTVTLNQLRSPSNNTTPSFTGTASQATPVTIHIYSQATATEVATATAGGTGEGWISGAASPPLPEGQYMATATQQSKVGKHEGASAAIGFTVNTTAPAVTLTYPIGGSATDDGLELLEGGAGTAPDDRPFVTISLFAGSAVAGQAVQELTVQASNGAWSAIFGGLAPGIYTAQARQADEAGNTGVSLPVTFAVVSPPSIPPAPPIASFKWFPSVPQTGESVSLVSSSSDATSPITGTAWAATAGGLFQGGGNVFTTSFATPGGHVVQLRVTNAYGISSTATGTIDVVGSKVPLMQPFPVVRIAGAETGSGVKLRLLTVQAPSGARITVTCRGHGCPLKSASRVSASGKVGAGPVEFRRFERTLPPGLTLQVRVSKAAEIGKYTRFAVRRGKLPERVDACLDPNGVHPIVCPSS